MPTFPTVGQLKDSVAGLLTGTNLNNVQSLDEAIERAARTLVQQANVPEASGRQIYNIYNGVYDYLAPDTIFGGAITDFRIQGNSRNPYTGYAYKKPIALFDRTKAIIPNGVSVTFEYNKGTPMVRVSETRAQTRAIFDTMSAKTGWAVGGSASGLALDANVYYESPGSLRFNLTGASSGYIEKTIVPDIDASDYRGVGMVFLAVRTPDVTDLTNIILHIGSDSSNYDSVTATEAFLGAFQVDDWFLVAFDLSTAISTGTPDYSNLDYARLTFTHAASITNIRVGELFLGLSTPYEMLFQSPAIFMAAGQNPSKTITNDDDSIILNDAAYTIFEYEAAITILIQGGGGITAGLGQTYNQILHGNGSTDIGLYARYRADNPSEELRTIGNWYND